MKLERKEYPDFIMRHIIHPYQTMIYPDDEKPLRFSRILYHNLESQLKGEEWTKLVFERLAGIYSCIDRDFLPEHELVAIRICNLCIEYGIGINDFNRRDA